MVETVINWKLKDIFKANAEKCYEEIGHDGATPEKVLNIARDPNTELHKCFEWDDSVAAEKYRLGQARKVIQLLVVQRVDTEKETVSAPKRIFQISAERSEYKPIEFIRSEEAHYESLLKRCRMEVRGILNRYAEIAERDGESMWEAMRAFVGED